MTTGTSTSTPPNPSPTVPAETIPQSGLLEVAVDAESGGQPGISGWIRDYLRDPQAVLDQLTTHAQTWLTDWAPTAAPALLATVIMLTLVRSWWRHRCHNRLATNARVVTILPPPEVDPAGAAAFWSHLVGLLRPAWRRALSGQPHLAWEYLFNSHGVHLQIWVPGTVPPGMIERAAEAAWPGTHTHTKPATPPIPAPDRRLVQATGGQLRLARTEALPLRHDFDADPLRALLGAPTGLGDGQYAAVQVLARPVTGHRVRRTRRTARHLHTGRPVHLVGRLLDLLTPGPTARSTRRPAPASTTRSPDHQTTLERSALDRAIVAKQTGAHYETLIRYAVATTHPAGG